MQMNKIKIESITKKTATNIFILLIALINTLLQIWGVNIIPINNEELSNIISTLFLIIAVLRNTWKNCNITTISQKVQQIADAIRSGELSEEIIEELISKNDRKGKGK